MNYRKKPVVVEAITFDEFVKYGLEHTTNIVDGMPWSFEYKGHSITHETNECYLIPTLEGTHLFTPNDMLITGVKGEIYPCKKHIFEQTYELAIDSKVRRIDGLLSVHHYDEKGYKIDTDGLGVVKMFVADVYKNIKWDRYEFLDWCGSGAILDENNNIIREFTDRDLLKWLNEKIGKENK